MFARIVNIPILIGSLIILGGCVENSPYSPGNVQEENVNLVYPRSIGGNQALPIVVDFPLQNPRYSIWRWIEADCPGMAVQPSGISVKRGRGSACISGNFSGEFEISLSSSYHGINKNLLVTADADPEFRELSGILSDEDIYWILRLLSESLPTPLFRPAPVFRSVPAAG